jgi:cephalosporin-C deacetylase
MNFTGRIRCPVKVLMGLVDKVCPPRTIMSAYNRISSPKTIHYYPHDLHRDCGGPAHNVIRDRWLAEILRAGNC